MNSKFSYLPLWALLIGHLFVASAYAEVELPSLDTNIQAALEETFPAETTTDVTSTMPAYFPPQFLLDKLEERLLVPPKCLPHCASIPRMAIALDNKQLDIRLEVHSAENVMIPLPGTAKQWLAQQVLLDEQPAQGLLRSSEGQLWLAVSPGIHQVVLTGQLPNRNSVQLPLPLQPRLVEVDTTAWQVEGLYENGVADRQLQFTRKKLEGSEKLKNLEMGSLPPFVQIERTLALGLNWSIDTRVTRLTPMGSAIVLEVPLLPGESVTSDKIKVEEGKALINLSPHEKSIQWTSVFEKQDTIELVAPESMHSTEIWRLNTSAIWHVEIEGIPVIHHQDKQGQWLPEWRPWAGEKVTLHLSRPKGVQGQVLTIDRSQLKVNPGQRSTNSSLFLNLRASRGGQHKITLPEGAQLQTVYIDGKSQPIRQEGQMVTLPIRPGEQQVTIEFMETRGIENYFATPKVALGIDSANTHIELNMPSHYWTLFTGGNAIGPAVLIWGILVVIALIAIGLGQVSLTPLNTLHWLLLGIVLSQLEVFNALIVVGWLMALGWRATISPNVSKAQFNLVQIGLVYLTLFALIALLSAIEKGLLGHPNMHIAGNGSYASLLRWYQDRTTGEIPEVWVYALPIWVYRVAMLMWALWLSFALVRWLRWGWECFSAQGLWRKIDWPTSKRSPKTQTTAIPKEA